MDGDIAPLDEICKLGDKYGALVFVDEAHATGFFGKTGRYENILHNYVHMFQVFSMHHSFPQEADDN
jgi:7-keto-8-aminopelargonate synthetase-like enzyme